MNKPILTEKEKEFIKIGVNETKRLLVESTALGLSNEAIKIATIYELFGKLGERDKKVILKLLHSVIEPNE